MAREAVRESRATARLPWDGEARIRAMPEAVVGPAPIRMASPEGGMVGFGLRWVGELMEVLLEGGKISSNCRQ